MKKALWSKCSTVGKYEAPYRKPKEKQYFSSVKKLSEKLVKNQQNDAIFFSIGILTLLQMRNIFGVCCVSQIAAFCVPLFLRTLDLNIPPPPPTPENEFGRCGQKRREASCMQRRGKGKAHPPPSPSHAVQFLSVPGPPNRLTAFSRLWPWGRGLRKRRRRRKAV